MSCFARDPVSPVTMTKCLDIPNNQAKLVEAVNGELPLEYSTVSVTLGPNDAIRAAVAVDCFVEVSGSTTSKCKYAGGVNFDNYPPCPLTCGDVQVGNTFVVNGVTFTRQDRTGLDALIGPTAADYETACTTGIDDFSNLFQDSVLNPRHLVMGHELSHHAGLDVPRCDRLQPGAQMLGRQTDHQLRQFRA